jgi:Transposase DDE domain.
MAVWRVLLNLSVTLLPTNGVVGIDASGFDRSHASKHYTKRTKLTIQQLKVTLLVDTRVNAIIDLHVTTTRKHDSKIAPSLIRRNTDDVTILLGDKGYDDQKIRTLAREDGVRPVIKHREFSSLHKAWNARLDADLYGQRSQNETVNLDLNGIRRIRPLTALVEAVPRTRCRLSHSQHRQGTLNVQYTTHSQHRTRVVGAR